MEREHLGGHPAGGTADLACCAEGVLRGRALEGPVGFPQAPDAVVELAADLRGHRDHELLDPVLAQPLMERGLLTNFPPGSWLDEESSELLAGTLLELVRKEVRLPYPNQGDKGYHTTYRQLLSGHWGSDAAPKAADMFHRELLRRGLVSESRKNQRVVQMHPAVRLLVLTVFVRILEACVRRSSDVRLQPITDNVRLAFEHASSIGDYLSNRDYNHHGNEHGWILNNYPDVRGTAMILGTDLQAVGLDLSHVPLDEVLDFRREQGQHYRAYARSLHSFLENVRFRTDQGYQTALAQRQEQIVDMADDLRRRGRKAFGRNSIVTTLSLAGATWTAIHGDPIGAVLAAVGAMAGVKSEEIPVNSYSYLFVARQNLAFLK